MEEIIMAEIRQKIISCPNGHYYDANRYADCPYCSTGGFSPTVDPFAGVNTEDNPGTVGGRTVGGNYGNFGFTEDPVVNNRASGAMSKTQFVDDSTPAGSPMPVVGWLVVIEGPCRGTDYRIHTGYNYIGRETGDICIHGDNTISAERDANVTYVPQIKRYFIAHELGKNVLLVNDMPVIGGSVELHNYDVITVGTTKLLFMGLCGEQFSWSDKERSNE